MPRVWAVCDNCGHFVPLELDALYKIVMQKIVAEVHARLRCRICKTRGPS